MPREERARAFGWDRSADHIRASSHNGCIQRPDTWLHPNASQNVRFASCTAGAVHTWHIVASNAALPELYDGVAPDLLEPPVNVMRLSLHPRGLAPRMANLAEWRAHLLFRLRRQAELTADAAVIDLLREVSAYPTPAGKPPHVLDHDIAVPFRIRTADGVLSFLSMTTVFGTPVDVMLAELALELFFPADDETAIAVQRMAATRRAQ